jgi:DNA phosphorothioation-associated putative methyltransferase
MLGANPHIGFLCRRLRFPREWRRKTICSRVKPSINATRGAHDPSLPFGKRLPTAVYIARPQSDWPVDELLRVEIRRAEVAARPDPNWNLLKIHTNEAALTFLTYPDFDNDPHPALAEATKINLNTGSVVRTDYRSRSNPPILHRKETFIPKSDSRFTKFAELTAEEEKAGLLRDGARIGLRAYWDSLLRKNGLGYKDHKLVKVRRLEVQEEAEPAVVERHRTAIKRYDISRPVKLALDRGILQKRHKFFDYGCGHGMDLEALGGLGYAVSGWDPAFRPKAKKEKADVVNLGYVLNVIEEPPERAEVLKGAFALAKRALVVSTMVAGQETLAHIRPYKDGYLTKSNTFQKFFAPGELEDVIESTLGKEAVTLAMGICVVFCNDDEAEQFAASRSRRRIDWSKISAQLQFARPSKRERSRVDRYELNRELLDSFWTCLLELGRAPESGEFDQLPEVRRVAGGLPKALNLAVQKNGPALFDAARQARSEDVLVYLAMTQFRRKFLRREIPLRVKNDIRAFFGDVTAAQQKARDLLFAAGDPMEIELAIEDLNFGVYDKEEKQFTFHRSLLNKLPPILRIYVQCSTLRYGDPEEADLIKIHVASGKLTFLHYDNFENRKEPILRTRIKINLRTQFVQVFDHSGEKQGLVDKGRFGEPPHFRK